ncbi:MAG: glutamate formimidoyltransferase [Prolixibacteraceae bacterium]|nr:glutamate formimidoyltransferase [Prolixibacteraceae bacterium]
MKKLIECVPNFSEGRNNELIKQITDAIESVSGIRLLNIDSGKAANRTVVTFVGKPDDVVEAAFRGIKKATEVIDIRKHTGEHPRIGATDVCPLVPLKNITIDQVVEYAHKLAERVGEELGIPIFCYEYAALKAERKNLANCRSGEYEALKERIKSDHWRPDFGPYEWNEDVAKTGATAIGARNFLIAYNINLDTTSVDLANEIAGEVRESGKFLRLGDSLRGKIRLDENNVPVRIPGTLKSTKAIGWLIEEYGFAQVSMNLTDISVTPVHIAFDEVCAKARAHGVNVTGSELIGLIPLHALLDAGKYYLQKRNLSIEIPEDEIIKFAIKSLGLDELRPFNPQKRILEYLLE